MLLEYRKNLAAKWVNCSGTYTFTCSNTSVYVCTHARVHTHTHTTMLTHMNMTHIQTCTHKHTRTCNPHAYTYTLAQLKELNCTPTHEKKIEICSERKITLEKKLHTRVTSTYPPTSLCPPVLHTHIRTHPCNDFDLGFDLGLGHKVNGKHKHSGSFTHTHFNWSGLNLVWCWSKLSWTSWYNIWVRFFSQGN